MKNSEINDNSAAFTLLEILVVIVVIVILAGMLFNIGNIVSNKNEIARTRKTVEALANAAEEFRAIYGTYPPVPVYGGEQPIRYEYPVLKTPDPANPNLPILDEATARQMKNIDVTWGNARLYTFGLLSFFFPRLKNHAEKGPGFFIGTPKDKLDPDTDYTYDRDQVITQWQKFNPRDGGTVRDLTRDIAASRRIVQHLEGEISSNGKVEDYGLVNINKKPSEARQYGTSKSYRNEYISIEDAWGNELMYQSYPPYNSFKIWSKGPDTKSGTLDDIVAGQE